ncbi:hypothetical protein Poli38472_008718 [Pythium oligandrum]|uniref:Uncharacterized protein n=1 Tax=Pythium oligandrum TaxID=41045 RepID=A0A8K1FAA9_PYTOL|nr:hypothetical protein Poli38472_008718 [Pythium oligandrum]|eukprot:TMW56070.1 hypothetical protein Poli38472_008718 [Pythium oligandrum]
MDDAATLVSLLRFFEEQESVTEDVIESLLATAADCDTSWLDVDEEWAEHGRELDSKSAKPKRPPRYNSNKAREGHRQELLYLRTHTRELELQLEVLKQRDGALLSSTTSVQRVRVWEGIATQQRLQRRKAEEENAKLKEVLAGLVPIRESFRKIFHRRAITEGLRLCGLSQAPPFTRRSIRDFGPGILRDLVEEIQSSGQDIDAICERIGMGHAESSYGGARARKNENGDVVIEIYQNKVLPFTAKAAGQLVWKNFSKIMSKVPFRRFYEREFKDAGMHEDIVVESIGLESKLTNIVLETHLLQVLRHYVEDERSAVLWSSANDPIRLGDQCLNGKMYRQRGFTLIQPPRTLDPTQYCVLTTCYIITSTAPCHDDLTQQLQEVLKLDVAAGMTVNHEQIENMLLHDALGQQHASR